MITTREDWLAAITAKLAPYFEDRGKPLPEKVRVSCGWPSRRPTALKNRVVGECWSPAASADAATEVFVSPYLSDGVEVGAVLVHELCHAAAGTMCGHKGDFRKLALALGLTGKMTATTAGDELKARLNALIQGVGAYPHATLDATKSGKKKQGTRMIKVICPECGYTVRTTAKWIEVGLPTCCCGKEMEPEAA